MHASLVAIRMPYAGCASVRKVKRMLKCRVCIDVDDVEKGIAFYTSALPLEIGRRFDRHWVELVGASCPIDLLGAHGEQKPVPQEEIRRDFSRHWTPVHLDFEVAEL